MSADDQCYQCGMPHPKHVSDCTEPHHDKVAELTAEIARLRAALGRRGAQEEPLRQLIADWREMDGMVDYSDFPDGFWKSRDYADQLAAALRGVGTRNDV